MPFGLLASVPLLVGGLLELPLGVLAGEGRRRRLAIAAGGIVFVLSLLGALGLALGERALGADA